MKSVRAVAVASATICYLVGGCSSLSSDPRIAEFERGLEAYDRGDDDAAAIIWYPLAQAGLCRAENALSTIANASDPALAAAFELDPKERGYLCWELERRAAEHGHHDAQHWLARSHYNHGAPPPGSLAYVDAIYWDERSASQGNLFALNTLLSTLPDTDPELALVWILRTDAVVRFNPYHDYLHLRHLADRLRLPVQMTLSVDQIERARAGADGWTPEIESAGIENGCYLGTKWYRFRF